jgi:transcriptional regulator with XRE-family HTH domain
MHTVRMTLDDFLTQAKMRTVEFARALGVDQSYASRLRRALVVPSAKQMREIYDLTGGAVQPNDLVLTPTQIERGVIPTPPDAPASGGKAAEASTAGVRP